MTEETLFHEALETPAAEREPFLDRACGSDAHLRQRLGILLQAHDNPECFLDVPTARADFEGERPGAVVGKYRLLHQLGEGGMGAVWLAEQTEPVQRKVALKLIKPGMDSKQVVARFEQERQALALMDHPNIAKVLDAGTTSPRRQQGMEVAEGRPYFVMELVEGVPITQFCDEHHLTPRERLRQFVAVCQAVQHAHQKGVIHRDLKPSNILVANYDDQPVVKVIDFGVSKATGPRLTDRSLFTECGAIVGTLEYMAPEQAELNQLDVDTRSDIYSLGVLLYELLTGSTPFERKRLREMPLLEILRLIREEEPPRPSTRLSATEDLPAIAANRSMEPRRLTDLVRGELDWIVMMAMEKDRNRRYETANALALDVQRYLDDEPLQAGPPSARYRMRKFLKRHRRAFVSAAILALALLLAVGGIAASIGWAARERASRQAMLEREIGRAIDEVVRLHQEGNVRDAEAALRRGEALLKAAEAGEEQRKRVEEWRRNLALGAKLEEIRLQRAEEWDETFGLKDADTEYRNVFREHDLDVDALPADELARRIHCTALKAQLLSALHYWAWGNLRQRQPRWQKLIDVARRADPDRWRDEFLDAFLRNDRGKLVEMARDAKVADLPPATVLMLARALTQFKQVALACEVCERVQRRYPGDVGLNLEIANLLLVAKRPQDAIGYLRAFLALRPRSPSAFYSFASQMYRAGRKAEAEAALTEALRLQPDFWQGYQQLASLRAEEGRLAEAEATLRESTRKCHESHHCILNWQLAGVLSVQGKWDEAEASYREALRLQPYFPTAHATFGDFLRARGKLGEAITACKTALGLDPNCAEAYCNLGMVHQHQGQFTLALDALRRGHELGSKRGKDWKYESAAWVKKAARMVELDKKFPAFLEGKARPADPAECLDLSDLCAYKRLYHASVRFFEEGFASSSRSSKDTPGGGRRYNAACYAALGGCGKGTDVAKLGEQERAKLRRQALDWLQAELEACRKAVTKDGSKDQKEMPRRIRHWTVDPDFAGVRGETAIAQLPESERPPWRKLWQDVEAFRKTIAGSKTR